MISLLKSFVSKSRFASRTGQFYRATGQTVASRSWRITADMLKRQFWLWPLIAIVVIAGSGYLLNASIKDSLGQRLQSELETLLHLEQAMVVRWFETQEASAIAIGNNAEVSDTILKLVELNDSNGGDAAKASKSFTELDRALRRLLESNLDSAHFVSFYVVDHDLRTITAFDRDLIGAGPMPGSVEAFLRILDGETTIALPFPSVSMLRDVDGKLRSQQPIMLVGVPIRDESSQIVAALAFGIRPEQQFTEILQLGKIGETGETYAIDENGLLISNSRFDEELKLAGLLPDKDGLDSILNVLAKDPGGDLLKGYRQQKHRKDLPLTYAAANALKGSTGVSLDGHRNYRGTPCISAWTWLPKYRMGIITEISAQEAFSPLTILRRVFFTLFGLLVLTSIALLIFTVHLSNARNAAREAAIEAKQLGQYQLEELLGEGAMGAVYRGYHSMLRRPTAIKLLKSDVQHQSVIDSFEQEVQLTCQLNNPHSVAIYDYGRTPEGVFYYAMEYLDGLTLQMLVDVYGPQPVGRVVNILQQICGSLYEAHSLGLVHRDIKPANIMINRRGGAYDIVKVLDFGLVRSLDDEEVDENDIGLAGTPMYMSPEAIQSPKTTDVRSDIYSLGAVAYFLLTGTQLYQAKSLADLFQQHIESIPVPPSELMDYELPASLENAIMACLEKSRSNRPQTARELAERIEDIENIEPWSEEDAEDWWNAIESETVVGESRQHHFDRRAQQAKKKKFGNAISSKFHPTSGDDLDATIAHER